MNRWSAYGQKDTQWIPDGDPAFRGINMLLDRGSLQAGYLARAENKRLRDGVAATRPGTSWPADFNPTFANKIVGSHIYSNPNGDEVMLVATASATYVWALQFGKDPVQIPLPAAGAGETGDTGTFLVHFCQAFDKVMMFRFPFTNHPTLVWDGSYPPSPTAKFVAVTLSDEGLALIPRTIMGVPMENRLLLYNPYYDIVPWRDQVLMTDVLDYTSYDDVLGSFRINAGESDLVTSVFPYLNSSAVIFMRDSIHMLLNFTVDPFQAVQKMLHNRLGSVGIHGPVMVGGDIIFLSQTGRGYFRLSQILNEANVVTVPVPISRPIQPVIDRIDFGRAHLAHSSAALDDYAFFAVPLDQPYGGASNAVLVLNTVSNEWESAPDWWDNPDLRIDRLHVTLYNNAKRLFGLDYVASKIYLLYEGIDDEIVGPGATVPVHDLIETRGYTFNDPGAFKRTERVVIALRSYDPFAEVTALSDGYNEEKAIATIKKDRTKFYPHGHADFELADDPNEPRREDYSIPPQENLAIEDFEELPLGPLPFIPPTPIVYNGIKTQSLERFSVRQIGRYCSMRIEGFSGQNDILGVGVEGRTIQETMRTVA